MIRETLSSSFITSGLEVGVDRCVYISTHLHINMHADIPHTHACETDGEGQG